MKEELTTIKVRKKDRDFLANLFPAISSGKALALIVDLLSGEEITIYEIISEKIKQRASDIKKGVI